MNLSDFEKFSDYSESHGEILPITTLLSIPPATDMPLTTSWHGPGNTGE
jgi:hypothetical protein